MIFNPKGRNSSAVEHFTRNEGVPSSNLGFGSKKEEITKRLSPLLLYAANPELGTRSLPFQREVWRVCLYQEGGGYPPSSNLGFGSKQEEITKRLSPLLLYAACLELGNPKPRSISSMTNPQRSSCTLTAIGCALFTTTTTISAMTVTISGVTPLPRSIPNGKITRSSSASWPKNNNGVMPRRQPLRVSLVPRLLLRPPLVQRPRPHQPVGSLNPHRHPTR